MASPRKPTSIIDEPHDRIGQTHWKGVLTKTRSVLSGLIPLLVCIFIAAFIVVSPSEKNYWTSERAWVVVQGATIVGPLVQHNVPTATVLLKNTGRSPAWTTKTRIVMTVWTSNKLPDWDMPLKLTTDVEPIREIGAGSVVPQTISLIAPLTDVQGMHLERKDWFIVILGIVSYIDIFGDLRETKLCLIWRDTSIQHPSRCEKWNEAD